MPSMTVNSFLFRMEVGKLDFLVRVGGKMSDCPDRRWAILRGCVVDKGQFVTHGH